MRSMESREPSQHLLLGTGKPRKTCVEVAGRKTFRILTSCQQSGNWSENKYDTYSIAQHKTSPPRTKLKHATDMAY